MQMLGLLALTAMSLTPTANYQTNREVGKTSIVLSIDGEDEAIVFPVVPANLPDITIPQKNETFESILGDMSVIGLMGLRQIKLEGLLPDDVKKYNWCYPNSNNATDIINFINSNRVKYIPFRITITRGSNCYLNMACLVNSFTYTQDNVGDYHYSLELIEYRMRDNKTGGLKS